MISTGELRKGVVIELDGDLWQILDYHHIKMGRGSAQVRIKLRNVKKGSTVEKSFQAGDRWPRAQIERRPVQYLYRDGDDLHFMETETYDQFSLPAEQLDDVIGFLKEGMTVDRTTYQGETLGVELPVTVDLLVAETEPGYRGRHGPGCAQERDAGDRPRRDRAAVRQRGRHAPRRHPDRRVPDPPLAPGREAVDRPATGRLAYRDGVSPTSEPDWLLPAWDAAPMIPTSRAGPQRLRARSGCASGPSPRSAARSVTASAPTTGCATCGSRARSAGSRCPAPATRTSRSRTRAPSSSASGSATTASARHSSPRPGSRSSPTGGWTCSSRRARSSSTSRASSPAGSATSRSGSRSSRRGSRRRDCSTRRASARSRRGRGPSR